MEIIEFDSYCSDFSTVDDFLSQGISGDIFGCHN